jgi:hypothetical protein
MALEIFAKWPTMPAGHVRWRVLKVGERNWLMAAVMVGFVVLLAMPVAARSAELVMLEEGGCPWCERWDEEVGVVYDKSREGRCAPLRRVDIHGQLPADLAGLRRGNYTPTFVLMENGREVGRIRGYPGEDFFYPMLNQLLERLETPCPSPQNAREPLQHRTSN